MKHLVTAAFLALVLGTSAQTGLVEFPYNPDADQDDLIGTADLIELLSLFGEEFSVEGIYFNNDSTAAHTQVGVMNYAECHKMCNELPGAWTMGDLDNIVKLDLSFVEYNDPDIGEQHIWINTPDVFISRGTNATLSVIGLRADGNLRSEPTGAQHACICTINERPKVEYSYCEGPNIQGCATEKTTDGWYPLGGIHSVSLNGNFKTQAFWRWAE